MSRRIITAPDAVLVSREEFLHSYWNYQTGEHSTFAGPSGWGKTWLVNELLSVTATTKLRATVLCMKIKDSTTSRFIRDTDGFERAHQWPPSARERTRSRLRSGGELMADMSRGWVLWPKLRGDPDYDGDKLYHEMRQGLLHGLGKGNRIIVADDLLALSDWLGLKNDIRYIYWNGRSNGSGLWASVQRPSHAPLEAYSQSHHIFIANSPDKRDRDRYREIGGINPDTIEHNLALCGKYQWLYIHRESGGCLRIDK